MTIDYYDLGNKAGQRGKPPDQQHADQPYYMQGYKNGAAHAGSNPDVEDIKHYIEKKYGKLSTLSPIDRQKGKN